MNTNLKTIRAKKTIQVSALRDKVNKMLLDSANENTEGRNALIVLLETMLHDSGNYKGFGYLDKRNTLTGNTYGVDMSKPQAEWFEGTDKTRVFYY